MAIARQPAGRHNPVLMVLGAVVIVAVSFAATLLLLDQFQPAGSNPTPGGSTAPAAAPNQSSPQPVATAPPPAAAPAPAAPSPTPSNSLTETATTDVPTITTPGLVLLGVTGLNVHAVSDTPVIQGQPVLVFTAASNDGRHYWAAQASGLKKGSAYRITAWVKAPAGVMLSLQGRDVPSSDTPPHNGTAIFDPTSRKVLDSHGNLLTPRVTDGPDGWQNISIDLPTSDGQFVIAFYLISGSADTFKGDGRVKITFGGVELAPL